jgi:hypothetical protein
MAIEEVEVHRGLEGLRGVEGCGRVETGEEEDEH